MDSKKAFLTLVVIALIALSFMLDMRRRAAQEQLEQLTVRMEQLTGNTEQSREAAKQIIDRVRKLIDIPTDIEPTVATIVDVDTLRTRNAFYNKAENGDHLIVTIDRAILYDPDANIILDVVPVQITPAGGVAPTPGA